MLDDTSFKFNVAVPSPVSTCTLFTYTGLVGPFVGNTAFQIKNLGTLKTDSSTSHFDLLYKVENSFTVECTCVSALYVDITYSMTSNCSYLSLVTSESNFKEIAIDYTKIDFNE